MSDTKYIRLQIDSDLLWAIFWVCFTIIVLTIATFTYKGLLYEEEQDHITIREMVDNGYNAMDIRCSWFYSERWEAPCAIHAMNKGDN